MAAQGNSLAERIARWELFDKALAPLIVEMPHLAEAHGELQRMIVEAKALEHRFEQMRAGGREASRMRLELVRQGDRVRGRLAAALKFHHGFESERLLEFGVKPRTFRSRARAETKPPEPPAPLPPPTSGPPAAGSPAPTVNGPRDG